MAMKQTIIETGAVRGRICGNKRVTLFAGIPYAAPTCGENRFALPQPPAAWEGVRDCTQFGNVCIQEKFEYGMNPFMDFFVKEFYPEVMPMGEDSLLVNVWTPAVSADEKLPVMFWIHGGGMGTGYGHEMEFDGEALCRRGVVVVTINYRVDVLGWFAHPELTAANPDGISGNLGWYDQNYALKWVQRNIAAFGGDPDNVTIFGQSAGGGSVVNHLIMPMSRGLFARAIIQSGSSGATTLGNRYSGEEIDTKAGEKWGVAACEKLGVTLADLRAMDGQTCFDLLRSVQKDIGPCPRQNYDYVNFPNAALTFYTGKGFDVPVMVGSVSGDNGLFRAPSGNEEFLRGKLAQTYDGFAAEIPADSEACDAIVKALKAGHFTNDMSVSYARALTGQKATYNYYFDPFFPEHNIAPFVPDGEAYHSSELWYVFGTLDRCWRRFDGRHYDLANMMMDYWSNFARNGDPNGNGLPVWPAFTKENGETQVLNERQVRTDCLMNDNLAVFYDYLAKIANQ